MVKLASPELHAFSRGWDAYVGKKKRSPTNEFPDMQKWWLEGYDEAEDAFKSPTDKGDESGSAFKVYDSNGNTVKP